METLVNFYLLAMLASVRYSIKNNVVNIKTISLPFWKISRKEDCSIMEKIIFYAGFPVWTIIKIIKLFILFVMFIAFAKKYH